jgi:hypothetical protein
MRKEKAESIFINLRRITRRINMIREGRDSNLLLVGRILAQIRKINIRMTLRRNIPWRKGEYHLSNIGDTKKITCTRISPTKRVK